jgi:uncharacterized phage-like protein YoqJ
MDREHTCCVTGHRDIRADKIQYVQTQLRQELLQAIQSGYTHFISGFAAGVDLIFAGIVADLKHEYPITLEAAIPYQDRVKSPDKTFQCLLKECDIIKVHTDRYSKSCFMVRNRYMVDCSALVIAVHDSRKSGGTAATISYAHRMNRDVREIWL